MLKDEGCNADAAAGGGGGWARVCDTCRSAACTIYCRADSAYLCAGCDARIHAANRVASQHERVWVCESCERAPAAFVCKADAASLCATCDADIHSANPLARRHHRVPVLPIAGCLYGPPATDPGGTVVRSAAEADNGFLGQEAEETIDEEDEDEAASWLLLNPVKNNNGSSNNQNNGLLFGGEVDEYLDLVEYNSCPENQFSDQYNQQQPPPHYSVPHKNYGGDRVVPVQCGEAKGQLHQQHQQQGFHLGMEYESSKAAYSYNPSISHSVSFFITVNCLISLILHDHYAYAFQTHTGFSESSVSSFILVYGGCLQFIQIHPKFIRSHVLFIRRTLFCGYLGESQ